MTDGLKTKVREALKDKWLEGGYFGFDEATEAAVAGLLKAISEELPIWDDPEGKPIPYNFHKNEEAVHAYMAGRNDVLRQIVDGDES